MDFMDLRYNCNAKSKLDGKYIFKGDCLKSIVVYNAKYKICKFWKHLVKTEVKNQPTLNQSMCAGQQR